MSLTSALKRRESAAARFMREAFPQTRPLLAELRTAEQSRPLLAAPGLRPQDYGLVGTAFDYRLRYYFAPTPLEELIAWDGMVGALRAAWPGTGVGDRDALDLELIEAASDLVPGEEWRHRRERRILIGGDEALAMLLGQAARDGARAAAIVEQLPQLAPVAGFVRHLRALLGSLQPVGRRLGAVDERPLCRTCGVLALFEQCGRAFLGGWVPPTWPMVAALASPGCTLDTLFGLIPPPVVDDLCLLAEAAHDAFSPRFGRPFTLNPTFAGSRDVGGADADLILDGCLLELKATKNPLDTLALYQLLGYALLDYADEHAIRRVGVYYARRGVAVEWPLEEVVARLSGRAVPPLAQLRTGFRAAVGADLAEPSS